MECTKVNVTNRNRNISSLEAVPLVLRALLVVVGVAVQVLLAAVEVVDVRFHDDDDDDRNNHGANHPQQLLLNESTR